MVQVVSYKYFKEGGRKRPYCKSKDGVAHIIGECETLTEERIEIFGRRNIEIWEIKHLMRVKDEEIMK